MTLDDRPLRPPDTDHTTFDWNEELGEWVEREMTPEEYAAAHPEPVLTERPPDTATSTWESHMELVAGVPTQVWTERLWTAQELEARAAEEARLAARATVRAIVQDLQAEKDRAQAVIDNPNSTPRERDLGRACKRIADAVIDLARYVG